MRCDDQAGESPRVERMPYAHMTVRVNRAQPAHGAVGDHEVDLSQFNRVHLLAQAIKRVLSLKH